MKKQVYNPYLPLYEYIPDGEPHVFNDRVYIYGSHDKFGAFRFCHNNYVTWSASINDLSDWRYEGQIYIKTEDPDNKHNKHNLYAPDVCKGIDDKYYLYYTCDWLGHIGIAKSDSPTGPFKFYDYVRLANGTILGTRKKDIFQFDPAILVEDNHIYLYSGFGAKTKFPQIRHHLKVDGAYVMELDIDMKTIKGEPHKLILENIVDPSHEFFEASSIRKINNRYYFLYSSIEGHELCYAISFNPMGPFKYGGVIISNGDVNYHGRSKKKAVYPLGNNHGGILCLDNDKYYIFYHRHTNYTNTDRQAMAEPIKINKDGTIDQVEMTSMGLNINPLRGIGTYPMSICSCLIPRKGNIFYPFFKLPHQALSKTYITQYGKDHELKETQYIRNVKKGCLIGYKYFDFINTSSVTLLVKGKAKGKLAIRYLENGKDEVEVSFYVKGQNKVTLPITNKVNKSALYIYVKECKGKFDFYSMEFK